MNKCDMLHYEWVYKTEQYLTSQAWQTFHFFVVVEINVH